MKKSKLILGLFLIASLGASAGETNYVDKTENIANKVTDLQLKKIKIKNSIYNVLNDSAELSNELSELYNIGNPLRKDEPEYFKKLFSKIDNLKNQNNKKNLKGLTKIENSISSLIDTSIKLDKTFLKFYKELNFIWDAPLNKELGKIGAGSRKSFNRIFEKIKRDYELLSESKEALKNKASMNKYDVLIAETNLKRGEEKLKERKENLRKLSKITGVDITFEEFEKAIKSPVEKDKLKKKFNSGKIREYFYKRNTKKETAEMIANYFVNYDETDGQATDISQNVVILENRIYGIQLEKNLNAEIEKNKTEHKKITDDISANKKEIAKKVNSNDVFTKTETNNLLNNKADKTELTGINNKIKNNLDSISSNTNNIKTNTDNITKINTDFSIIKEDIKNLKANTTVVDNKPLIDENIKNIKANTDSIITNKNAIDKNVADIKVNTTGIATNKTAIDKNTKDIATNKINTEKNSASIKTNLDSIVTNKNAIDKNVADIKVNTTGIATNKTAIDKNTKDIATNKINTEKNSASIKTNLDSIVTNKTAIDKNTKNIATNKINTEKNSASIKTNLDSIVTNKNAIDKNIKDIATNKINTEKNSASIKTNTENISKNTTDIKEIKNTYVTKDNLNSAIIAAKEGGTVDKNGVNIGAKIKEDESINVVVAANSADGKETTITGTNNSVFGIGHTITGNGNTVIGDPTHVDGNGNIVLGNNNNVKGENNVVLGNDIKVDKVNNAIVLGNKSVGETNTVSVGSKNNQRRIINVADAKRDTDAVNLR